MRCLMFVVLASAVCAQADTLLVFGDSLSAGYGLARGEGWVDLLQARLAREGYAHTVVNASISGDTTLGGRNRIEAALATHTPAIVIVELGANDGLRGQPVAAMRSNLEAIVEACRRHRARVLLVGMRLPPNYGSSYTRAFQQAFESIAGRQRLGFVPFLFEGFAEQRERFQPDGLHPNAAAQPLLLDNVWRALAPLLKQR
jgi:acyl-CoA thioesterase-1